jgi:hypothetical protein
MLKTGQIKPPDAWLIQFLSVPLQRLNSGRYDPLILNAISC